MIARALAERPRASSSSFSTSPGCGTGPASGRVRAIAILRSSSVIIHDLHVPGVSVPELEGDPLPAFTASLGRAALAVRSLRLASGLPGGSEGGAGFWSVDLLERVNAPLPQAR